MAASPVIATNLCAGEFVQEVVLEFLHLALVGRHVFHQLDALRLQLLLLRENNATQQLVLQTLRKQSQQVYAKAARSPEQLTSTQVEEGFFTRTTRT